MKALILAAGTGSRLGKYTKDNTKCMLEVNSSTLIIINVENHNNIDFEKHKNI